jgi:transposase
MNRLFGWAVPLGLLRALLLQVLYTIRSERMLMEQLEYNLLFRSLVGLNLDEAVWDRTVFSKNRARMLEGDIAQAFLEAVGGALASEACSRTSLSSSSSERARRASAF